MELESRYDQKKQFFSTLKKFFLGTPVIVGSNVIPLQNYSFDFALMVNDKIIAVIDIKPAFGLLYKARERYADFINQNPGCCLFLSDGKDYVHLTEHTLKCSLLDFILEKKTLGDIISVLKGKILELFKEKPFAEINKEKFVTNCIEKINKQWSLFYMKKYGLEYTRVYDG